MPFRLQPLLCMQLGTGFLRTSQVRCAAQDLLLEEK